MPFWDSTGRSSITTVSHLGHAGSTCAFCMEKSPWGPGRQVWPHFPGVLRDQALVCLPALLIEGSPWPHPTRFLGSKTRFLCPITWQREGDHRLYLTLELRPQVAQAQGEHPSHPWPSLAASGMCFGEAFNFFFFFFLLSLPPAFIPLCSLPSFPPLRTQALNHTMSVSKTQKSGGWGGTPYHLSTGNRISWLLTI